jgi:ubiquinone/menaquinone biosynthesis C-methylase UbiE
MFFEPYAIEVANRVEPSSVKLALELAAGTGRVTRQLRKRLLPSAKLIASDISEDMLQVAKEKLKDENIGWQIIDAQQLPFEANSIDLVVCCFGLMFVPDRLKAVSEVYRVLWPGGMFIFSTWDKLETVGASSVYRNIVKQYLTGPLPGSYDLPTSMHDESIIKPLLQDAGFSKISIEKVSKQSYCSSAKEATEGLTMRGAIYHEIMSNNPESIEEIKNQVEKELSEKYGAAPMVAPMSAVISHGWK